MSLADAIRSIFRCSPGATKAGEIRDHRVKTTSVFDVKGFWGTGGEKKSKRSSGQIGSRPLVGTCIYSILLPVLDLGFLFNQKQPKVKVLGFVLCFSQYPVSIPQENCSAFLAELKRKRRKGSDVLHCSPHI